MTALNNLLHLGEPVEIDMANRRSLETFLKTHTENIGHAQEVMKNSKPCDVMERPALFGIEPELIDFGSIGDKVEPTQCFAGSPDVVFPTTTRLTATPVDESLTGTSHSKQLEDGCEDLEDRLLEGALKNLEYFPQLFREIERLKKEKEEQERVAAEKQRVEELKAEQKKMAFEREKVELLNRRKANAVRKAHSILEACEKEKLCGEIERVHAECRKVSVKNDKLRLQLRDQEEKVERLARLQEKVTQFMETGNVSQTLATTSKCQQLLGISRDDLYTVKHHEEFLELSKLKRKQAAQLSMLEDKLTSLNDQLETERAKVPLVTAPTINGCSMEELKRRVQELHDTKRRLTQALDKYNQL